MSGRKRGRLGRGAAISVAAHVVVVAAILWRPVLRVWAPPQREATVAIVMTNGAGDQRASGDAVRPQPVRPVPKPTVPAPTPAPTAAPAPPRVTKQDAAATPAPPKTSPQRPQNLPMEFGSIGGPSFNIRNGANGSLAVSTKPDDTNLAPIYPPEAARRHEAGTVALVLHIAADGFVDRVDVVQSSGYKSLDEAAVSRLRTWHFTPATRGGMPVASSYKIAVTFGP